MGILRFIALLIVIAIAYCAYNIVPSPWTFIITSVIGGLITEYLNRLFNKPPILDEEKLAKSISRESQKLRDEHETKIHQNKLILSDLENWMGKTHLIYIDYRDGELSITEHRDPVLPHFKETKKVLGSRNVYTLWTNSIETSNNLKKKGEKTIEAFHVMIDKELEVIPLKKSLKWGLLPKPSYSQLRVRQSIFDGIKNIENLNLSIKDRFLNDGTRTLAEGEPETLFCLKKIIEKIVENELMREKIRIYDEVKEKLDWRDPFKEFHEKLDEIIQEYRFSKVRS